MPNKKHRNNHLKINLNNIIKRLPLHQQLNASQNEIIKLSQAWKEWAASNLPPALEKQIILSSFDQGILNIRCNTPTAASHLKHLQMSLLEGFHTAGFKEVENLKIQINHQYDFQNESTNNHTARFDAPQKERDHQLKSETLSGIKQCSKTVKNERLMASLEKLAETLEQSQPKKKSD